MNKVIILGRLTSDVELKKSEGGTEYARFSVAVNRFQKDGQEKEVDFFQCFAFNQIAEFLSKYGKKGARIQVEGRMQFSYYGDDNKLNADLMIQSTELIDWPEEKEEKSDKTTKKKVIKSEGLPF